MDDVREGMDGAIVSGDEEEAEDDELVVEVLFDRAVVVVAVVLAAVVLVGIVDPPVHDIVVSTAASPRWKTREEVSQQPGFVVP